MKYPDQKQSILRAYQKPVKEDPMVTMADKDDEKTMSIRCYVKIKSNPIKAIINTGAAISIITRSLMKKLNLKIEEASKIIVIIANGKRK